MMPGRAIHRSTTVRTIAGFEQLFETRSFSIQWFFNKSLSPCLTIICKKKSAYRKGFYELISVGCMYIFNEIFWWLSFFEIAP